MVKTLAASRDKEVKDALSRRAILQAEVRGLVALLRKLLLEDRQSSLIQVISEMDKLTVAKDKENRVMSELNELSSKLELDMADILVKEESLNKDVQTVMIESQEWVAAVRAMKARFDEHKAPEEEYSCEIGAGSSATRNFEEITLSQKVVIDSQRRMMDQLTEKLNLMESKVEELHSAHGLIENLKDVINKQQSDHDKQTEYFQDTITRLREEVTLVEDVEEPSGRAEAMTSSPKKMPGRRESSLGRFSTTAIDQEDLLALSHIMQKSNSDVVKSILDENNAQQKRFYQSMLTPKIELKMFTGDLTKYQSFINRFDDIVGNLDSPYSVKLNTLLQYCSPEVLRHLECCEYQQSREGYHTAREILKKRYGRPHLVVNAWLEKMMGYQKLRGAETMLLFASDLKSCKKTLQSMDCLSELDNTDRKRILVSKLPSFLQNRWRKKVRQRIETDRQASLDDLIELVTEAAEEQSDPIYGADSLAKIVNVYDIKTRSGGVPAPVPKKKEWRPTFPSNAVSSSEPSPSKVKGTGIGKGGTRDPCACCGQGHFTRMCDKFRSLSSAEKLKLARTSKLCILCLSPRHAVDDCQFTWRCQVVPCGQKHNNVFHDAILKEEKMSTDGPRLNSACLQPTIEDVDDTDEDEEDEQDDDTTVNSGFSAPCLNFANRLSEYAMPVCPVKIHGPNGNFPANVIQDTGGGFSIITRRLQERAGLHVRRQVSFDMSTIVSGESLNNVDCVSFCLNGLGMTEQHVMFNAVVLDRELLDQRHAEVIRRMRKLPYLKDLNIPIPEISDVDILIGQDNAHLMKKRVQVDGYVPYSPYAVQTPIGWTVHGFNMEKPMPTLPCYNITLSNVALRVDSVENVVESQAKTGLDENLALAVDRLFQLEQVPDVKHESPENLQIEKMWREKTVLVDEHIQVPLPIKNGVLNLPNNYSGVLRRHEALGRRLIRDEVLRRMFVKAMHENFELGYAEDVNELEEVVEGSEWYIPIQPVESDKKPGKCRIVGDSSYVFKGACLNDAIHQGPNYTANIVDILIKFRRYEYVVIGDIKHMYNQVRVPESERNCLRFLWWKNDDPTQEVTKHRMKTQMFGGTWSPSASMHALNWLAEHYADEYHPETIITILRHFYVDDLLRSIWDEMLGVIIITEIRSLLGRASFHLTKIGSNSRKIMESVPVEDRIKSCESLDLAFEQGFVEHTLGCVWGLLGDLIGFNAIKKTIVYTRCGVLSVMSSLYDPLGLVSPFVLRARIILQEIVKRGYDWDDRLTDDLIKEWDDWIDGLQWIVNLKIPRWIGIEQRADLRYQLHTFVDASERGYGAVVYFCVKDIDGEVLRISLLAAKAKVAPAKLVTIPRLELSAAVVGVKLSRQLADYLEIELDSTVYWSDSTIVLHYLNGKSWHYRTFVANRVAFIQEHTLTQQWRHIDTDRNVGDIVSRGLSGEEIGESDVWKNGPIFLRTVSEWPGVFHSKVDEVSDGDLETKRLSHLKFAVVSKVNEKSGDTCRYLLTYYSRWNDLVRAVCCWRRVIDFLRNKMKGFPVGNITATEVKGAILVILRLTQQLYITDGQQRSRMFEKLYPVLDDGMWHVGGRLMNASLSYEERFPLIFPESPVLESYIFHIHERTGHGGVDRTYFEARKTYWILGGKRAVKKVINRCVTCRKNRGKFQQQVMAPLPKFRVEQGRVPFERVGVDYFGPFYVKVGRAQVKRYACMITDLLIRACHVEIAPDLTSSSFVNALQRFICRRGKPVLIVSDNGTNFVGANRELSEAQKAWNYKQVGRYMSQEGITWIFNTPTASHHGGAWERLIRSFRSLALAIVKDHVLTEDGLRTYACLIENVMNSRPLTKISEEPDNPLPLTPEHLLNMREAQAIDGDYEKGDVLRQRWKSIQYFGDRFWKRWVSEYLKSLQIRQKWTKELPDVKVGDVVLVLTEGTPRLKWPLGLVIEVVVGRDQHVRSVRLRTSRGEYVRPITKIVNLECG